MKRILMFIFCFIVFFQLQANAEFWADTWINAGYYETNAENPNFRSVIERSELRFGYQPGEDFTATPYIVLYNVYGQDANYWNNNLAYGVGLRLKPFTSFDSKYIFLDWITGVKLYSEILALAFLKDQETATANKVKTNDFRIGLDVWHEWNLQNADPDLFWAEMWSNLSYRNTNFYDEINFNKFQTYVGYFQLKVGRHIFNGLKPYAALYVNKSGADAVWLNNILYGIGLRIEPYTDKKDFPPLLQKFKMFVEILSVSWFGETERPKSDFRFGIEFTQGR